jgi:hypothetical protein
MDNATKPSRVTPVFLNQVMSVSGDQESCDHYIEVVYLCHPPHKFAPSAYKVCQKCGLIKKVQGREMSKLVSEDIVEEARIR